MGRPGQTGRRRRSGGWGQVRHGRSWMGADSCRYRWLYPGNGSKVLQRYDAALAVWVAADPRPDPTIAGGEE